MRNKKDIVLVVLISLLFIAANSFYTYRQSSILSLVPFVLLSGMWVFFAPTKLFYGLAFLVPLSVSLSKIVPGFSFDFWFPTEPILVFLLLMLILKSFKDHFFQKELLKQPVFISMLFYLVWLLISVVPSEMPIVSIKYFLVRFWFIGIFFYLAYFLFKQNTKNINLFLALFIAGLAIVAIFSIIKQSTAGLLNHHAAYKSASPFFVDHTSYGATLAFTIPFIGALALNAKRGIFKFLGWGFTIFLVSALIFSYSRAAWLSLLLAIGVWFFIYFKIKFRTVVIAGALLAGLFFTFQHEIKWRLERNTTDSSGDFAEHVKSMYNIRSDASNLERINRWDAAWDMFCERPLFGWGPGTYQFVYAPFQKSQNLTIISTNFGNWGNAHSEYLGLMSEAGLPSVLAFISIWVFALLAGFKLVKRPNISREHRNLTIACLMGLITYISHAFLNNFLDMDKIAAPFWGSMAIILALEYHYKELGNSSKDDLAKTES
ncbi:MAG: O-antigen ligase family protein [Bacteroidales bacterium]|nr:O-antigen ligase family protein [Bacteroidales bacterium]MDD3890738.1 O-antigen ligase family protein [Bacteroidales bacterium]